MRGSGNGPKEEYATNSSFSFKPLAFGILAVAVIVLILVVVYPGFLFGVLVSIPFWNTPALPLLFFLSGLDTGIAALVLLSLSSASLNADGLHWFGIGDIVLIFLLLIVVGAYLEIVRQAGVTAAISIRLLKTPLFIVGAIILGMLLPISLLVSSIFITDAVILQVLAGITGVLVLLGGLFLRYSVIRAGVQVTVR